MSGVRCGSRVDNRSYVAPDPPTYTTIADARADIQRLVKRIVEDGGAWLLAIPPGGGKSRTTLVTLVDWARAAGATPGSRRILYLAPRHELLDQVNIWTGGAFVHIWPREAGNCERHVRAAEVAKRGFRADRWVCPTCPRFKKKDCGYWEQWKAHTSHWAMTYDMAVGIDLTDKAFAVIVMDESIVAHTSKLVEVHLGVLKETAERAFPKTKFPDGPGFHDLTFEYGPADRAWGALVKALKGWTPDGEVKERGAAAAARVAEMMTAQGVADPEAGLRALLDGGFSFSEEGEFDPEATGSGTEKKLLLPPSNWIETVLRTLIEGLEQRRKDPTHTGAVPLRIEADPVGGWLLVAGARRDFRLGDAPIVHLDGTGDATLAGC